MQLGLVGLGKMGFNMRERLREGGHEVIGYDPRPEVTDVPTLAALAEALEAPRVVWVMVPSGSITDETITSLAEVLAEGDMVVDGGNSRYTEDGPHAKMLGEKGSLLRAPWPKYDPALAEEDEIEIPVQINGKLRGLIVVPAGSTDDIIRERALSDEKIKAAVAGKQVVKVILVPAKLVNIVVR